MATKTGYTGVPTWAEIEQFITDQLAAASSTDLSGGPVKLAEYDVAGLPDAADWTGHVVYISDGEAGSAAIGVSDGTNWLVGTGAVASAT